MSDPYENLLDELDEAFEGHCEVSISRVLITHLAAQIVRISASREQANALANYAAGNLKESINQSWDLCDKSAEGSMIQ